MTVDLAQEELIIGFLTLWPDDHFVLPEDQYNYEGRVLVSRDGFRIYLHRRLWFRMGRMLLSGDFLLPSCEMGEQCLNPNHRKLSRTPMRDHQFCRNNHPYTEYDVMSDGSRRCSICAANRAARRVSRGGLPNWKIEQHRRFCPNAHEYTPSNTYVYATKAGGERRKCKACTKARAAGLDPADVVVATD